MRGAQIGAWLSICSMGFLLTYCMNDTAEIPILQLSNISNTPIWIGLTNGHNVIFKGELPPCQADHPKWHDIYRYDKDKNPLGIDLEKKTEIVIWLFNPWHKCKNPQYACPIIFTIQKRNIIKRLLLKGIIKEEKKPKQHKAAFDCFCIDEEGVTMKLKKYLKEAY